MDTVKGLVALATQVSKLDALATAATAAESCQLSRGDRTGMDRACDVRLTFLDEPAAKAFTAALAALVAKPATGPRPVQMTSVVSTTPDVTVR